MLILETAKTQMCGHAVHPSISHTFISRHRSRSWWCRQNTHVLKELMKAILLVSAEADPDWVRHIPLWGFTYIPLSPQNSPVKWLLCFHLTDDKTELGWEGQSNNFPQARELVSTVRGPKSGLSSAVNYPCPYPQRHTDFTFSHLPPSLLEGTRQIGS